MSTEIKLLVAWLIVAIAVILIVTRITEAGEIIQEPPIETCEKWTVNESGNVIVTCTVPLKGWVEFSHPAQITAAQSFDVINERVINVQPGQHEFLRTAVGPGGKTVAYIIDREPTFFRKCGENWINAYTGESVSRECCR